MTTAIDMVFGAVILAVIEAAAVTIWLHSIPDPPLKDAKTPEITETEPPVAEPKPESWPAAGEIEYWKNRNRPSILLQPTLSAVGGRWRAVHGESRLGGVAGYGGSPAEAYLDFDRAWAEHLRHPEGDNELLQADEPDRFKCPECGSLTVMIASEIEADEEDELHQRMECAGCRALWEDSFVFKKRTVLRKRLEKPVETKAPFDARDRM